MLIGDEETFTLDDPLLFSAKVFDSGDTEPALGFYKEGNFVSQSKEPKTFLGYIPDVDGNSFVKVITPGGNAVANPPTNLTGAFELTISYDPDAGDNGQISYDVGGDIGILDLTTEVRNGGVEFTHFGLNVLSDSHDAGFRTGEFYFDDVTFTSAGGVAPILSTRFEWNASGLGDWGDNDNWSPQGGVAIGSRSNNPNHTAVFGSNIGVPTNVSTMDAVIVNRVEFNNAAGYLISGFGSVNMASNTASPLSHLR